MNETCIYLDYAATTPVEPAVLEAMLPWFTSSFGNASSRQHPFGWEAAEAIAVAKEQVAALIGGSPSEICFTSGATESINLALSGLAKAHQYQGHIITATTEHKAVLNCCEALETAAVQVTYLPVDAAGRIDPAVLKAAIRSDTWLICLMLVNNETGVIHPIAELAEIAKESRIPVMVDCTQAAGTMHLNLSEIGVDIAVLSAHKIYGPKGIGGLFLSRGLAPSPSAILFGGSPDHGLRPGTANVPAIVGFGKAASICLKRRNQEAEELAQLRNVFEQLLSEQIPGTKINGLEAARAPHISNITLPGIEGAVLMRNLRGIAVSQGAACNLATQRGSHVLEAMGLEIAEALSSLRVSFGRGLTESHIREAVAIIEKSVNRISLANEQRTL